ncbi:hypothetical protein P3T76_013612 [Phytophthora citrophthora]|uniref:Uncharacterized protein n=1 Tax=Phytophthora citrophthora TaxID=4793 RepID=A0AAD9G342_9STRA|nr:hypothetical protein P3T76_013612 [Phytophthora citrophthora]
MELDRFRKPLVVEEQTLLNGDGHEELVQCISINIAIAEYFQARCLARQVFKAKIEAEGMNYGVLAM